MKCCFSGDIMNSKKRTFSISFSFSYLSLFVDTPGSSGQRSRGSPCPGGRTAGSCHRLLLVVTSLTRSVSFHLYISGLSIVASRHGQLVHSWSVFVTSLTRSVSLLQCKNIRRHCEGPYARGNLLQGTGMRRCVYSHRTCSM